MTTTRRWVIGTAIAVVVILAAGWMLLVKPQKHKVSGLHDQTATQLQANQLLLTQISALQAEQKELPQQQLVLQKFATEIPDTASEPAIIRALTETAKGAGVDLATITPGSPTLVSSAPATASQSLGGTSTSGASAGTLYSLPLSLAVSGGYSNIESFFSGLEHLPRAFLVSSFNLNPGSTSAGSSGGGAVANSLNATISTAVFYATVAPVPPPATVPQPASTPATGTAPTPAPTTSATANPAASAASAAGNAAGEPS